MNNEKYYRYFRVSGPEVVTLLADYDAISAKRKLVLEKMLQDSGAVAYTERRGWGENGTLVESLVFSAKHDFGTEVTIKRRDHLDGKPIVIVRGKGRTAEARELNQRLEGYVREANEVLAKAPSFRDYLIQHYQVACDGIGGPTERGFGSYMISTNCGKQPGSDDTLLFAIPIKSDGCRQPEVPASFEEITYGQFYDLSNAGGAE